LDLVRCFIQMCSTIKITVSVEFDNKGQSLVTQHNQMHMFSLV